MIKNILENINNMESSIKKAMIIIVSISLSLCVISSIVLVKYIQNKGVLEIYESGIILFRTGLDLAVFGFICSIICDNLKKKIV